MVVTTPPFPEPHAPHTPVYPAHAGTGHTTPAPGAHRLAHTGGPTPEPAPRRHTRSRLAVDPLRGRLRPLGGRRLPRGRPVSIRDLHRNRTQIARRLSVK